MESEGNILGEDDTALAELLDDWADCPSLEAMDRITRMWAPIVDAAAEAACRTAGLAAPPEELTAAFVARVLWADDSELLRADLCVSFTQTCAAWMLEQADELVVELASSSLDPRARVWQVLQAVRGQNDKPTIAECATCIALHGLDEVDRRTLVARLIYDADVDPTRYRDALARLESRRDDILQGHNDD